MKLPRRALSAAHQGEGKQKHDHNHSGGAVQAAEANWPKCMYHTSASLLAERDIYYL